MKPERWQQIETIYHSCLEREPDERPAYLDEACGGDEALRQEVESLVMYDGQTEEFIEAPALEVAAKGMAGDRSSHRIGNPRRCDRRRGDRDYGFFDEDCLATRGQTRLSTRRKNGGLGQAGQSPQWRKWRTPVKTMATPRRSATATTSASRTDPPG